VKPLKYTGPWSYSKLRDFETCRAQFNRRHMLKLPEPPSAALEWGSEVHEGIEAWMQGWLRTMPDYMKKLESHFIKLKDMAPTLESMWGHDKKWAPLANGFDKSAWVRAKTDAFLLHEGIAYVLDWKTGKKNDVNQDQLKFYGVLALIRHPGARSAKLELWYVEHGTILDGEVKREDLAKLKKEFERRSKRLYAESRWEEEPGLHCKWCPFRKSAGGPCKY